MIVGGRCSITTVLRGWHIGDDFCSRSEVAEGSGSHGKIERWEAVMSWSTTTRLINDTIHDQSQV